MPYKNPASKKANDRALYLQNRAARLRAAKRYRRKNRKKCARAKKRWLKKPGNADRMRAWRNQSRRRHLATGRRNALAWYRRNRASAIKKMRGRYWKNAEARRKISREYWQNRRQPARILSRINAAAKILKQLETKQKNENNKDQN